MAPFERDFDYEQLPYGHRLSIHTALAEVTIKHVATSNGLFEPLAFDPARYHSQLLETVHLEPVPATFEDVTSPDDPYSLTNLGINTLASFAGPDLYPKIQDTFQKQRGFMDQVRRLLVEDHQNITVLAAPHKKLQDIALVAAGWANSLRELPDWEQRNGIGISRGITTIGAFGTAASQILQKIGHVYLSFPRTNTFAQMADKYKHENKHTDQPLDIDRLITTNNRRMRSEVAEWSGTKLGLTGHHHKGVVLHLAEEGKSTHIAYEDSGKPAYIELGTVSDGTIQMVKHGLVLPVTVWEGKEPIFELGELTKVENRNDMDRVRNGQREILAKQLGLKLGQVALAG